MSEPIRIQRKRAKGWKMPPNTLYVGRPTKWGNLYCVGENYFDDITNRVYDNIDSETAVQFFSEAIDRYSFAPTTDMIRAELRGKNLACWCKLYDENGLRIPCHADILLALANNIPLEEVCAPLTIRNSKKSDVLNVKN